MTNLNEIEDSNKLRGLPWMLALSQAIGIAMIIMIGVWLNEYLGGFAWDGSGKEFNVHPLCMVCGMVFLYGEAMLVYRVFRNSEKLKVKVIHAVLFFLTFIAAVVGLVAVFQFHYAHGTNSMYSMHSWIGMTTIVLFGLQLLIGFLSFLFPGAQASIRKFYLPIHQYFGGAILFLSGMACISGINEKLFFILPNGEYSQLPPKGVLGNMCGIVIVAFIVIVVFIVRWPDWKREPLAEEEGLSVHFRTLTSRDSDSE